MIQQILKTKRGKWALALVVIAILSAIISAEALEGAVVLIIIAVALVAPIVKGTQSKPPAPTQENTDSSEVEEIKITISTQTSTHYVECFIAEGETVSLVDLGGYESPSGGYVNWAQYEVRGKNISTGRQNTRQYTARDEMAVTAIAEADGLTPPFQIQVLPNEAPTDRQTAYLRSWNVEVPAGAVKEDVSAILGRLEGSRDIVSEKNTSPDTVVRYVRPTDKPNEEFAMYAHDMGVLFSRYIGNRALFYDTVYSLSGREQAAFFAYCVLCSYHRTIIKDLRNSEYAGQLYAFADMALSNENIMRSIGGRPSDDYLTPHKGTKAYKAVAEFFGLK